MAAGYHRRFESTSGFLSDPQSAGSTRECEKESRAGSRRGGRDGWYPASRQAAVLRSVSWLAYCWRPRRAIRRSAQRLRQPSLHRLGVIWPNQRHRAAAIRRARQQAAPEDLGRRVVREHAAVRGGANRVGAPTQRLVATDEADALDGAGNSTRNSAVRLASLFPSILKVRVSDSSLVTDATTASTFPASPRSAARRVRMSFDGRGAASARPYVLIASSRRPCFS